MSSGNGGARFAALGALCTTLFFIAIATAFAIGLLGGKESERRQQTPATYGEAAKADAERACAGRQGSALLECVYERVEARQEQANAEQDLTAQQRAANSALAAAIISFLTLAVTGIGVWFVKRTLDATLQAVEDTGRATEAMRDANAIAKEASENQIRPWLAVSFVETPRMVIKNGNPWLRLSLVVTNKGNSPAIQVSYVPDLCIGHEPHISAHAAYSYRRKELLGFVGDIFHGAKAEFTATVDYSGDPAGEAIGFITVTVFYRTVFSEELRTTAVFYRMIDTGRDDEFIDFSQPLSHTRLELIPWEEMAGVIE